MNAAPSPYTHTPSSLNCRLQARTVAPRRPKATKEGERESCTSTAIARDHDEQSRKSRRPVHIMPDLSVSPLARLCIGARARLQDIFQSFSRHRRLRLRFIRSGKGVAPVLGPSLCDWWCQCFRLSATTRRCPCLAVRRGRGGRGRQKPKTGESSWLRSPPSSPPADFKNRKGKNEEYTDVEADIEQRKKSFNGLRN